MQAVLRVGLNTLRETILTAFFLLLSALRESLSLGMSFSLESIQAQTALNNYVKAQSLL